ncbi:MAG: AAA family ATPase [archaeon]
MLLVDKLKLKNFKSFNKVTIPFSEGFTTIVGANASGKSNVIDAILFAFGATSLKSLRANKLVDLVNYNSKEGIAEVFLELKETGKDEPILLNRSIDRHGRSVARLNNKRKPLNELSSYLQELGVTPQGHNIILQGDVTRIVEMSAKERRTIIDEISGIKEFDEKKARALKELSKVELKLKEASIVLNERTKQLNKLSNDRNSALKYLQFGRKLKQSRKTLLRLEEKNLQKELKEIEDKISKQEKELKEFEEKTLNLKKTLTEKEGLLQEKNDYLISLSQKETGLLHAKLEEKRTSKKVFEERQSFLENEKSFQSNKLNQLRENRKELKENIEKTKNELVKAEEKLNEVSSVFNKARKAQDSYMRSLKEKEKVLLENEEQLSLIASEKNILKEEINQVEKELHSLENQLQLSLQLKEKQLTEEKNKSHSRDFIMKKLSENREKILSIRRELTLFEKELKLNDVQKNRMIKLREQLSVLEENQKHLQLRINEFTGVKNLMVIDEKNFQPKKTSLEKQLIDLNLKLTNLFKKEKPLLKSIKNIKDEKQTLIVGSEGKSFTSFSSEFENLKTEVQNLKLNLGQVMLPKENELKKEQNSILINLKENAEKTNLIELELKKTGLDLRELNLKLEGFYKKHENIVSEKNVLVETITNLREKLSQRDQKFYSLTQHLNSLKVSYSGEKVRLNDLTLELKDFSDVKVLTEPDLKELKKSIPIIEEEIRKLEPVNLKAIDLYKEQEIEVQDLQQKTEKLSEEKLAVENLITEIEVKRVSVFMTCFNEINKNFQHTYSLLANNDGSLQLTDYDNPIEAGLLVKAKHEGEQFKNIEAMSGGEKSLTALSFLFAIQLYSPSSFYILDEVDAALDDVNSTKLSQLIQELSKKSQFIAITHNDTIIKHADQVVGIALNKEKKVSVVGLKLKSASIKRLQEENSNKVESELVHKAIEHEMHEIKE